MAYVFEALSAEYASVWRALSVPAATEAIAAAVARRLLAHRDAYAAVEAATGVPLAVVAAIHEREADGNFHTYLGNGDPFAYPTTHVPAGRGPFATWQDGAIDALRLDALDRAPKPWTIERAAFELETFNGFGYRKWGVRSPYLWAGSNAYAAGKFTRDGHFDPAAVDAQLGAMVLLRAFFAADPALTLPLAAAGAPVPPTPLVHDAKWIQARLNTYGASPPLVVDGALGPASIWAIAAFLDSHTN